VVGRPTSFINAPFGRRAYQLWISFSNVGFLGETFLLLDGSFIRWIASSTRSLGGVTLPCFCLSSSPSLFSLSTSSSPPYPGDFEAVSSDSLLNYWTSTVFFLLLVPGVSFPSRVASGMPIILGSDSSVRSAGIRSSIGQSLVVSSRSSSMSL
jgi:hypothetical protein